MQLGQVGQCRERCQQRFGLMLQALMIVFNSYGMVTYASWLLLATDQHTNVQLLSSRYHPHRC
eukprot:531145-Amphidinium_carterae.2